ASDVRQGPPGGRPRLNCSGRSSVPGARGLPVEAIQQLAPEAMTLREARVVEVVDWVVRHADALHDRATAHVRGDRERDDLVEADRLEAERERRLGGLGRE